MYYQFGLLDYYVKQHIADLERQIAHDRLVAEATRFNRPLRARLADGLYALAARIEGQPRYSDTLYSDKLAAAA